MVLSYFVVPASGGIFSPRAQWYNSFRSRAARVSCFFALMIQKVQTRR